MSDPQVFDEIITTIMLAIALPGLVLLFAFIAVNAPDLDGRPTERDAIIAELLAIEARGDRTLNARRERLMLRLWEIDGKQYNPRYWWVSIKSGKTPKSGMSAAIEAGGLAAAGEYGRIMSDAKKD